MFEKKYEQAVRGLFTTGTSFIPLNAGHLEDDEEKRKLATATYAEASVANRKGRLQTGD
jgi:hypothetical protein